MNSFSYDIDLPEWLWLYFPFVMLVALILAYIIAPNIFFIMIAKDSAKLSLAIVEHGTVLVLLPGILAGLWLLIKRNNVLPNYWIKLWFFGWVSACIYFAGEEASWGQWFFHWNSPEWFIAHNEQQETNLHNLSSWLNQKPRALVELWVVIAGCIIPLYYLITGQQIKYSDWRYWCYTTKVCLPTGLCFLLIRIAKSIDIRVAQDFALSSELREYYIATFLSIYLMSACKRAAKRENWIE